MHSERLLIDSLASDIGKLLATRLGLELVHVCRRRWLSQQAQRRKRRCNSTFGNCISDQCLLAFSALCMYSCMHARIFEAAFPSIGPKVRDFKFGAVFKVCIISFETMRKFSKDLKGHCDILICDEGHRCILPCCCFAALSLMMSLQ